MMRPLMTTARVYSGSTLTRGVRSNRVRWLGKFKGERGDWRSMFAHSTSVAFNCRASCRARSHAEFTTRTGIVAEEADESQGWLEFVETARLITSPELPRLIREST